ncbi:hypothetical protein [Methylocella silvestris]|uniref:hypothetical protein n=1 Tax=Methylocella silvestris TaxID=199596 RepID=UPI001FDEFCE2|nr:hypothetical protein [Methylocella silvestris]
MNDPADHPSIVDPRLATRIGGKMRRNLRKLRIRQPKLVQNHRRLPFGNRESQPAHLAKPFMGLDPN